MSAALSRMAHGARSAMAMVGFQVAISARSCRNSARWRGTGRDPASIEITSFALGEDPDRVKRLAEMGVARVVPMFPPEKADTVLPIVDRWTKVMRQVNG